MSYILDALRKSETERRQGRVPDLGQQVQLVHRPRKRSVAPAVWVVLALLLNAGVLALVLWPKTPQPVSFVEQSEPAPAPMPGQAEPIPTPPAPDLSTPELSTPESSTPGLSAAERRERAAVIVPSVVSSELAVPVMEPARAGRVPHLVELPPSFQKSVPDLMFNSHIFSSSPGSRRVTINGIDLRVGDAVEGFRVEDITEDGVVLGRDGRRFRLGVVRDWVSPR